MEQKQRVILAISLERVFSLSGKTETNIKGVYVAMHQNVKYPGVVYFRTVADAQKAVKILGKKAIAATQNK